MDTTQDEVISSEHDQKRIGFGTGVMIALAVLAAQFIAVIIGLMVAFPLVGLDNIENLTSMATGIALIVSFPLAVWWILRKRNLSPLSWKWQTSLLYLLPFAMVLMYSVTYVLGIILEYMPGYDNMVSQYTTMFEDIHPVVLIVGGGFIGPICEEIIFRGVILKEFLKTYPPQKAIVLSSVIFGIIHFIPLQVVSAFFAGLILGYVYYKTKSLWLPIIMHVFHNLIAFAIGLDHADETTRDWFGNDLYYFGSFILAAILALAIYKFIENKNWSVEDSLIP